MNVKYLAAAIALASISTGALAAPINLPPLKKELEIKLQTVIDPILKFNFKGSDDAKRSTDLSVAHTLDNGFGEAVTDVEVISNLRKVDFLVKLENEVSLVGEQLREQYPVKVSFRIGKDKATFEPLTDTGIALNQEAMKFDEQNKSQEIQLKLSGDKSAAAKIAGADTYNGVAKISVTPQATTAQ